jgi:hypothetical protein
MGGKPDPATIAMAPPFLLNPGSTFIHMHVVTPGLRRKVVLIGPRTFILSAIAKFIAVAFAANRTGQSKGHCIAPFKVPGSIGYDLKT